MINVEMLMGITIVLGLALIDIHKHSRVTILLNYNDLLISYYW